MKKNTLIISTIAVIVAIATFSIYVSSNKIISNQLQEDEMIRLNEIASLKLDSFNTQTNEQIKKIKTMSDLLGNGAPLETTDIYATLQSAADNNNLLRCAIAFPDGSFITNDHAPSRNVSDMEFFIKGMAGEINISNPQPAVADPTKTVILFTSPIEKGNTIIGTLTFSYLCDDLYNMFNLNFLKEEGQVLIVKEDGTRLIGQKDYLTNKDNILTFLSQHNNGHKDKSATPLNFRGDKGSFVITNEENESENLLVIYNKVATDDWYMVSIVPEEVIAKTMVLVTNEQNKLGVMIATIVSISILFILFRFVYKRANVDKMTGLPTLINFKKAAAKQLKKNPNQQYVLIKLDVKDFKLINRIYDFSVGDKLIINIARALELTLKEITAIYSHISVDEFVIFVPYSTSNYLNHLRAQFIQHFKNLMGPNFMTVISFPTGQYITTQQDSLKPNIDELFEKANFAHRAAKQSNTDEIVDFEETIEKQAMFEKSVQDRMNSALENNEFQLYLQPKVCLINEEICGAEALVRWIENGKVHLYPSDFISIFEKNGFITRIDKYMFEKAAEKIRNMIDLGQKPVSISVNFSKHHLRNIHFVEELCEIADKYNVPHKYLEVELLESVIYDNIDTIVTLLEKLHQFGFTLSMDDFGSGYSSLGLLKDLAVDVIKIDKSFFDKAADSKRANLIIENIINMSKALNIKTVAEGVETKDYIDLLKRCQCDIVQGYYYSKPIPADQFDSSADLKIKK